jgi:hypothetical protein
MEGSYAPHGTNAPPLPPHLKNLIKNIIQECTCSFLFLTIKLTGDNGAQRNCRPVQRLVMPSYVS